MSCYDEFDYAQHAINLDNPATGIYTVIFIGKNQTVIRKILVTR